MNSEPKQTSEKVNFEFEALKAKVSEIISATNTSGNQKLDAIMNLFKPLQSQPCGLPSDEDIETALMDIQVVGIATLSRTENYCISIRDKAQSAIEKMKVEHEKEVIDFLIWIQDNGWVSIYSNELKKRAYVDSSKVEVLLHGSDFHFTVLIKIHGKTEFDLLQLFRSQTNK